MNVLAKLKSLNKPNSSFFNQLIGILGEVAITVAAVILLYVFWQHNFNNLVVKQQQSQTINNLQNLWGDGKESPTDGSIPVGTGAQQGEPFGVIYIPRLGEETARVIVNSADKASVLDKGNFGHYPKTQMPGQNGNFAMAVHRTDWGSPFADAPKLQAGDKIFVETQDGYYTYVFRNYEFVTPKQTDVLNQIPGSSSVAPIGQSVLTITTCNPLLGSDERMISYAVLETWQPRSAGPPADMTVVPRAEVTHNNDSENKQNAEPDPSNSENSVVPSYPVMVSLTTVDDSATIYWTAPEQPGSEPIESYVVVYSLDGGGSWNNLGTTGSGESSYTTSGLSASTTYTFGVYATSSAGAGPVAVAGGTTTGTYIPSSAQNLIVSCNGVNCDWQFDYPSYLGIGLVNYELYISEDSGATWVSYPIYSNTGSLNLSTGTIYIRSSNAYGESTSTSVSF